MNIRKKAIGIVIVAVLLFSFTFLAMARTTTISRFETNVGSNSDAGQIRIGSNTDTPIYDSTTGDIDGDGSVTPADARLALRAAVGLDEVTEAMLLSADVDHSGDITPADARIILRRAVGLSD